MIELVPLLTKLLQAKDLQLPISPFGYDQCNVLATGSLVTNARSDPTSDEQADS